MSTYANAKLLVGRTIVKYESGTFPDGRGGTAHNPRITLDNGAVLYCVTEETEGDYGVALYYQRDRGYEK